MPPYTLDEEERRHPQHRHLDADRAGRERVVAHRAHLAAQRRVHDEQPEGERDREDDELEVVVEVVVAQVDARAAAAPGCR